MSINSPQTLPGIAQRLILRVCVDPRRDRRIGVAEPPIATIGNWIALD